MILTAELNQKAKAILIRELGHVNYARFIQQSEEGTGDYHRNRRLIPDPPLIRRMNVATYT